MERRGIKVQKNIMDQIPQTPPFLARYNKTKEQIYKAAAEMTMVNGVIPAIESAFANDPIAKEVCYMIATSHEYKKPNTENSIAFVRNYSWQEDTMKTSLIEGVGKPVDKEKVLKMATEMQEQSPIIVVNQIGGIRPQSRGKAFLFDGHHRLEAYRFKGYNSTPVYIGTFTGKDSLTKTNLLPKFPTNRRLSFGFDFDDTIYSPKDGINEDVAETMRLLKKKGHLIILYTCRDGASLFDAVAILRKNKIPFDAINENPDFSTGGPKMYADLIIDNRAINVLNIRDLLEADIPDWKG
jgi:hypothetical protein